MDDRSKKIRTNFVWRRPENSEVPPESTSQLNTVPPEVGTTLEPAVPQIGGSENTEGGIDVNKEIEQVYNRPRRRRRREQRPRSRKMTEKIKLVQTDTEEALMSASLLRSPPSPARSPPSPPRSPPSPLRHYTSPVVESLHVAIHPRASTQSQLSTGIAEEVAAQVMKMLTTEEEPVGLGEPYLEEMLVAEPPPTPPQTEENFDGEVILEPQGVSLNEEAGDSDVDNFENIPCSRHSTCKKLIPFKILQTTVSEPSLRFGKSLRATSTGIGYSRFRRPGEGFLDLEFKEPDDKETEKTNEEIVVKANSIKKLVKEKRMGLPQAYSDHIVDMADDIIARHSNDNAETIFFRKKYKKKPKKTTEEMAQKIISIADKSEGVLKIVESTRSDNNEGDFEAAAHLEKMVKELHCRHRALKKLAEEIIAKRWKLQNIALAKKGKPLKSDGGQLTAREAAKIRRKQRKREWKEKCEGRPKKSRKRNVNENDLNLIYSNPMAKLKNIAKSYGGPETWKEDDPLSQALNKVGVEIVEKCYKTEKEEEREEGSKEAGKRVIRLQEPTTPITIRRRTGQFPSPTQPDLIAKFSKSAMTIFVSNYSKMVVSPSRVFVSDSSTVIDREHTIRMLNIDKTTFTNHFVDIWKRRSYSAGILTIIMTALLHCVYLCGPRMGDNYVTYAMVESLSGWPWYFPTGIYGLIFLGYLFGGMSVIKTAAAVEHNLTVKAYFKKRKIKFFVWYLLVTYFLTVFIVRCVLWYENIRKTDKEMRAIFNTDFFYNQIPSRMLYSQFLFSCCGANGPGDYPDGKTIGWPKSCYVRVNTYEEYYEEPGPIEYGCSAIVYVYGVMGLAVITSLCLLILILAILHPIYLYVYELFICLRSKEPEPWLEYTKD